MLKQEKPEITRWVEAAVEMVLEAGRGGFIHYDDIQAKVGIDRSSPSWGTFRKKLSTRLEQDHQIVIRMATNCGIQVLTHEQAVIDTTKRRGKKIASQVRKGTREIECSDSSAISIHLQQMKVKTLDRFKELGKEARQAQAEAKVFTTESLPKRLV